MDEGDESQWYSSAEWAQEGWAEEEENAGAVYDEDDAMIAAFCGCVYCPEPPLSESGDSFRCLLSDENCKEQVCAITFDDGVDECDDEPITDTYWCLRDVDG